MVGLVLDYMNVSGGSCSQDSGGGDARRVARRVKMARTFSRKPPMALEVVEVLNMCCAVSRTLALGPLLLLLLASSCCRCLGNRQHPLPLTLRMIPVDRRTILSDVVLC